MTEIRLHCDCDTEANNYKKSFLIATSRYSATVAAQKLPVYEHLKHFCEKKCSNVYQSGACTCTLPGISVPRYVFIGSLKFNKLITDTQ